MYGKERRNSIFLMPMIRLYIDSDSLPVRHRTIVLRRLIASGMEAWFAADRALPDVLKAIEEDKRVRRAAVRETMTREEARRIGSNIHMEVVPTGDGSADDRLVELAEAPGLAITHDIPLASRLLGKGLIVIDDRGNEYTADRIRERLSEREANARFREMGLFSEGRQQRFDERTVRAFAAAFDKALSRLS